MQNRIGSLRDLNMVEYWRLKFQLSILLLLFVSPKITTFIVVCKRSFLVQVGIIFVGVGYTRNPYINKNYGFRIFFVNDKNEVNNFDATAKA